MTLVAVGAVAFDHRSDPVQWVMLNRPERLSRRVWRQTFKLKWKKDKEKETLAHRRLYHGWAGPKIS